MEFEWDEEKSASNFKKHDVDFDEATTVFDDLFYVDFYDPKHSVEEHRFLIIGKDFYLFHTPKEVIKYELSAREN